MFLALFWKSIIAVAVLIIAAITKCFASIFSISVREPFVVACPITQLFMHPLAHHCVLVFAFQKKNNSILFIRCKDKNTIINPQRITVASCPITLTIFTGCIQIMNYFIAIVVNASRCFSMRITFKAQISIHFPTNACVVATYFFACICSLQFFTNMYILDMTL